MLVFVDQSGQLGGAELCLADLAGRFLPSAKVVLLSGGPFAKLLEERRIPAEILPLPGAFAAATKRGAGPGLLASLPALVSCAWRLRRSFMKADAIYLNTAKALLLGTAANALARRPCIFHLHDLWDESHFSHSNIRLLAAAANHADAIIANSRASADSFLQAGGKRAPTVIPNGFDVRPFDNVDMDAVRSLREERNPSGGPVAAVFGRLARWKGQHLLLEAAAGLPELTVWIVGDALFTPDDQAYADDLRRMAAPLGPRVWFAGFRDDIPALMAASDVIVHCSVAPEPFGRVVVEGMLSRKPVVAADAGGPKEILRDPATGVLYPTGDARALESALRSLLASPATARAMGLAGRHRAESAYSLDRVAAETAQVLRSIVKP